MKKLLAVVAFVSGLLVAAGAHAQTVLPRAGWVANASSSNGGDVPANVLDGSSSSRWSTGGNQNPGQWFTVDFGTAQTFSQVTMDVGSNSSDYARNYELYVSNDGQTWGAPIANGIGATGTITIAFSAQTARFIGIVQTGTASSWWSITELNVYSGTVPTVALTPSGWTATASVAGSGTPASNAIDGSTSTRFSSGTNQVNGQWLKVDLGSTQLLAAVKMDSGTSTTDYARGYQIYVSSDGSNWGSAVASGTPTTSPITAYFAQASARYVKIVQTGTASNWWSIAELTLYTPSSLAPTASVLPRSGWTATASSSSGSDVPANMLDDSASTRWTTGANQANGQSFKLDMQTTWSLTKITLDAGSSSSDYPRAYQVFVSTDGTNWGSAVASGTGSGALTTITFPVQVARYIKVVQTGSSSSNWWSIAEVNVYGTAPALLLRDNWTATASLNSSNAQQGIDGKIETEWSTGAAQVNGQLLKIDMKAAQTFNEITLDVTCNPADYARGYQVFVSNDGTSWGSAVASGTGMSSMITVAFASQTARYLKVVQTASATNYWGVAELNVINTNPTLCATPCVAMDACHDVGTCNPATGVCSNPPKTGTSCSDGNACNGAEMCNNGVCQAGTPLATDDNNPCTIDSCDAVAGVQHTPGNAGTVCRASAGSCDVAETCTGTSAACPADAFAAATTVCRQSAGACDVAETCTGSSAACPADARAAAGTTCRGPTGTCDVAEVCDGSSTACPTDGFVAVGTTCRAATGACDVAEVCTGTSAACPADGLVNAGTVCRAAAGACDVPETCTGSSVACPADGFAPPTITCRGSAGACDVPEQCSGSSPVCPADVLVMPGTVCRASAGECDVAEACTGASAACPADGFKSPGTSCNDDGNPCTADACGGSSALCQHPAGNPGTVCRAASGACDVAETCTGSSTSCPNDTFAPPTTTCRASAGACDVAEQCTGSSGACPPDTLVSAGTVCRASGGECDVAEACTGNSVACPNDTFAPPTTTCRASVGSCDVAEQCTGTNAVCPPDAVVPVGTVCRASAGACDVAEACNGTSGACPSDGFAPSTTTCRASVGSCDVAEQCTGTGAACPADTLVSAGTVCRASAGECDLAETCNGTTAACPNDAFAPSTTTCRASVGSCDVAEQCTGTGAACPADTLVSAGTVCRASAGECDLAETCNGTTAACPNDAFAPSTTTCRASVGACDVAEQCTGASRACPPDAVVSAGTVCRASAGDCDVAEACNGTSTACPNDAFAPSTTTCRVSAGACDVAEQCTGTGAACPSDSVVSAGTVCRGAAGECDVDEKCDGTSTACPVDGFAPPTTVCRSASGACDVPETCTGSAAACPANTFVAAGTICRAAASDCDVAEVCSGTSGACPNNDFKQNGTTCNDGNSCTTSDVCTAGTCMGSGSCNSSVNVVMEWSAASVQPSLPVTVAADRPGVRPGDTVNLTMTATFDGVSVNTDGEMDIANTGTSDYVIPGYSITVEYQNPVSNEWIAIAKRVFDSTGQQQQNPADLPDVVFQAAQVVRYDYLSGSVTFVETPGVTYAPGRMAGTRIIPGATAISNVTSKFVLPEDAVHLLSDPAQASALREVLRIDAGPGLPIGSEIVTPISLPPSGNLVITDLTGWYATSGATTSGFFSLTPATIASLSLGSSATFTGSATIAPLLSAAATANQFGGYKGYLHSLAARTFSAIVSLSGSAPGFQNGASGSGNTPELPTLVPILEPTLVSGSPSPQPLGYPLNFDVALANVGTDVATNVNLQDAQYVFSGSSYTLQIFPATITAPSSVVAGTTPHASMVFDTTGTTETGFNSFGQVTWSDVVGNTYGPFQTAAWPIALAPARPLGTLTLVAESTAPAPVEATKTFTATAVDPHGAPAPGVTVQLTVTGVNPQVLSAQTDASGAAHFSYAGKAAGGDTLVASATITTAPTTSGSQEAFWSAPYGHCTSPDVPLDVALVIDTSSSMEGAPLAGAKAAAHAFLNTMDLTRDQLAVVSFGGVSTLNAGLTSDFAQASTGIDGVEPGGGFINPTNIGAGLSTALDELASSRARSTATPIIVFVSDGGNSFGDPEPALARLAASGIRTFAFGLGPDADFAMLQRIATTKNELFYVPTADELGWLYKNLQRDLCRNQAPLAYAGGDQGAYGVRLPDSLTLHGEVHDDGPASLLTSQWSVVSGPGTVTFTDASSPTTTALFSDPGTYVLKLEASDGVNTGSDTATVTVDFEPSLAGATLVASLGTPGPLTVGMTGSFVAALKDSGGQPIARFPIQLTITGANAGTSTLTTDANGVATFTYVGGKVGTDVLAAVALGSSPLSAAPVSVAWTAPVEEQVVTQGWIGAPTHQSTVKGPVGITVGDDVTLTSGTVTYWPLSAPDQVHTLATSVNGGPGVVVATLDTTVLANGPWVVKIDGTDDQGHSQISEVAVTVSGDYKPGRVVVDETDLTVPLPGIPLTVGRRYDSLEKDNVGDFGHGWSLSLGHPRLEVDPAHNVTITMPDNRRVTFYFQAASASNSVLFDWLFSPGFVPETGTFGSLSSDGCSLMVLSGGQLVCFVDDALNFAPTTYKYTDPYGRVFTIAASGELKSFADRQGNTLTFTPAGIFGGVGQTVSVAFERDTQGRITSITSQPLDLGNGRIVQRYAYDDAGDLVTVTLADNATKTFTYSPDHRLLTSKDPNGNAARTSTYDTSGHLLTDTDPLGNVTNYSYDFDGHKTTITNPDHGTIEQTFDERGLLLKERDSLGNTTLHTYDTARNELTRTNALGEVSIFAYDAQGNQTSSTNGRGETSTIAFNAHSQPVVTRDPVGHATTIEYSDLGVPIKFSDELGAMATFTTSSYGLPTSITDALGNTAHMAYDDAGHLTTRTDRLGRTTTNSYDGVGRLTQNTDPRGTGTRYYYLARGPKFRVDDLGGVFAQNAFGFLYDENLNLVSETSDLGRFTNYTYDALNHVSKVEHSDHSTTRFTRDFRGNALTETDEAGHTKSYEYDTAGQLKKTTFADGTFVTRVYDPLGRLSAKSDELGNTVSYEYEDGCGCSDRITKVTAPDGRATVTTYDAAGRPSSVTDAAGHTTSYAYDLRGHLTTTTFPDNTSESNEYDVAGRRIGHTDQMGVVTRYAYDAEGQLTSVTDGLSGVTSYGYDASGNLTSITDVNNHTTTYAYDHLSRKSARTLPLGMTESWTYDMYGDVTGFTDFRGKTTSYTYDARARLLTKTPDPTLGEPTVTYTYNPTGTRATMVDASGVTTYAYDQRNRLIQKTGLAGALTYTYDAASQLKTIRSSNVDGTSVDYGWDSSGHLASVADNRVADVSSMSFDVAGRPQTLTRQPSGVGASYTYDALNRVTTLGWTRGAAPLASWTYAFNARGEQTAATDATGRRNDYQYDALRRLTSEAVAGDQGASPQNGSTSYSLDALGNRLSRTSTIPGTVSEAYQYDANDQAADDTNDINGNTLASQGHTYAYDFENRLTSKDGSAVKLVYDGDGNRVSKTAGGVTTKYLVDDLNPTGVPQVLEEVVGTTVDRAFTYGTSLISLRSGSDLHVNYYGFDARGNVAFLTDATGSVTDTYEYDAWGRIVSASGPTQNERLWLGEELDLDLGLVNLRSRFYNPATGRFLTLDTGQAEQQRPISYNRYLYAEGDPINQLDRIGQNTAVMPRAGGSEYAALLAIATALVTVPMTVELGADGKYQEHTAPIIFAVSEVITCELFVAASAFGVHPTGIYSNCQRPTQDCESGAAGGDGGGDGGDGGDGGGGGSGGGEGGGGDGSGSEGSGGGSRPLSGGGGGGGRGRGRVPRWVNYNDCYNACSEIDAGDWAKLKDFIDKLKYQCKKKAASQFENKMYVLTEASCRALCRVLFGNDGRVR